MAMPFPRRIFLILIALAVDLSRKSCTLNLPGRICQKGRRLRSEDNQVGALRVERPVVISGASHASLWARSGKRASADVWLMAGKVALPDTARLYCS